MAQGSLTHAVVAEAHVVERYVVLSDGVRAVSVEPQGVVVLPNPVVEPPDFEGHVLRKRGKEGQTTPTITPASKQRALF